MSSQGSACSSQRGLMPCIWGTDLVVVARFRAAAVPRLCGDCPVSTPGSSVSVTAQNSIPVSAGMRTAAVPSPLGVGTGRSVGSYLSFSSGSL